MNKDTKSMPVFSNENLFVAEYHPIWNALFLITKSVTSDFRPALKSVLVEHDEDGKTFRVTVTDMHRLLMISTVLDDLSSEAPIPPGSYTFLMRPNKADGVFLKTFTEAAFPNYKRAIPSEDKFGASIGRYNPVSRHLKVDGKFGVNMGYLPVLNTDDGYEIHRTEHVYRFTGSLDKWQVVQITMGVTNV